MHSFTISTTDDGEQKMKKIGESNEMANATGSINGIILEDRLSSLNATFKPALESFFYWIT